MSSSPTPTPDERTAFQVERLAFFSDAVFAIAITLLALNINAPGLVRVRSEHDALVAMGQMVPRVIGFVLSFLVIGNYWRSHHRLFRWVRDYDANLVTINLLLLLSVSFIPCPTAFYSDYADLRTPLIFYALSLSAVGLLNYALWRYFLRRPALLDPAAPMHELAVGAGRSLMIPMACGAAIILSFASLWLARLALLSIPLWVRVYTLAARRRRGA